MLEQQLDIQFLVCVDAVQYEGRWNSRLLHLYFKLSSSAFKETRQFCWSLSWFCRSHLKCVYRSLSHARYLSSLLRIKLNLAIAAKLRRGIADLTTEIGSQFKDPSPLLQSFLLLREKRSRNCSLPSKTSGLLMRLNTAQM